MNKVDLLRDLLVEIQQEDGSVDDKMKSLGPLLFMCNKDLTERQFVHWLDILGVNYYDSDVESKVRDYLNLFHFSGMCRITVQDEFSWVNEQNINSFRGIVDEEYVEMLEKLKVDTAVLDLVLQTTGDY